MRRSVYMLVVVICLASPLAAAQGTGDPPALATAEQPVVAGHATASTSQSPTPGAKAPSAKSRSAFGQAMNELIRAVSESRTKPDVPIATKPTAAPGVVDDARASAAGAGLAHAVPATTSPPGERAVATPADAEAPRADGERQEQIALQSGPDDPI